MITALSPGLSVRKAISTALQADAALVSIVSTRIYPGKLPNQRPKPFVVVPLPAGSSRWFDGGAGGSDLTGVVHCYVGVSPATQDAETVAANINAHIVRILDAVEVVLDGEVSVAVTPTLDQVLRDPDEADVWHGIVSWRALAT